MLFIKRSYNKGCPDWPWGYAVDTDALLKKATMAPLVAA